MRRAGLVIALAATPIFAASAQSAPTPGTSVSVNPATGLNATQAVQVTGAGFTGGAPVQILQCTADLNRCRILTNTSASIAGNISATVQVSVTFVPDPPGDVTPIDCRISPYCVVFAIEATPAGKNNFDDIHFVGELPPDNDGDGVPDATDNCPNVANPGQANTDGDALGDVCDPDDDNDSRADLSDACPLVSAGTANGCPAAPPTQATCQGQQATIVGTPGNDALLGTAAPDVIASLGGADTVSGLGANDLICGGSGKDRLRGGSGKDRLYGEGGADKLDGSGGNDLCKGGKGRDSLSSC